MQEQPRNKSQDGSDHAEVGRLKDYPIFRLYIKGMVDFSGFPSASEMENATKNHRGYEYSDEESALVARVKYLHQPTADLLAVREKEWARKGVSEEVRRAVKDALKIKIADYLSATQDPKGMSEEQIRGAVQSLINESEDETFRSADSAQIQ